MGVNMDEKNKEIIDSILAGKKIDDTDICSRCEKKLDEYLSLYSDSNVTNNWVYRFAYDLYKKGNTWTQIESKILFEKERFGWKVPLCYHLTKTMKDHIVLMTKMDSVMTISKKLRQLIEEIVEREHVLEKIVDEGVRLDKLQSLYVEYRIKRESIIMGEYYEKTRKRQ